MMCPIIKTNPVIVDHWKKKMLSNATTTTSKKSLRSSCRHIKLAVCVCVCVGEGEGGHNFKSVWGERTEHIQLSLKKGRQIEGEDVERLRLDTEKGEREEEGEKLRLVRRSFDIF